MDTMTSPGWASTPAARNGDRVSGSEDSPGRIRTIRAPSASGSKSAPSRPWTGFPFAGGGCTYACEVLSSPTVSQRMSTRSSNVRTRSTLGRCRSRTLPQSVPLMRDFYWREDMDGTDWGKVLGRHRPSVERVRTFDDLVDILWETVGELNTSHAYVQPPPAKGKPVQGLLGADFEPDTDGARIVRILPGESSDPEARSPLRAAGVDAQPGDVIVSIDGQAVDRRGVGPLLVGAADTVVEVTLRRGGTSRRVAVIPTASETPLRYQAWVASRIAYVEEA